MLRARHKRPIPAYARSQVCPLAVVVSGEREPLTASKNLPSDAIQRKMNFSRLPPRLLTYLLAISAFSLRRLRAVLTSLRSGLSGEATSHGHSRVGGGGRESSQWQMRWSLWRASPLSRLSQ